MRISIFLLLLCYVAPAFTQPIQYIGKIGKYPVHMRLEFRGNKVSGGYYYDKHGIVLLLNGTSVKESIVLNERDENSQSTGTFVGKVQGNEINGSWKQNPKAPSIAFKLTRDNNGNFSRSYVGTINNKYRVQMKLTRKGNDISGMYYYEKTGLDIPLRGIVNPDESVAIDEYNNDGELQASFIGKLAADFSLQGQWSKLNGKPMPFMLKVNTKQLRRANEYTNKGSAEVFNRVRTNSTKNIKVFQTVEYPQLRGMSNVAVQQKLNKLFLPMAESTFSADVELDCKDFESELSFNVSNNSDSILCIDFRWYEYSCGAHPNHGSRSRTFDLRDGLELRLGNIFKKGALQSVSKLAEKKILQQYAEYGVSKLSDVLFDETLVLTDSTDFVVHPDGLTFHFDPYEIAAYALGDIDVAFFWSELDEFLLPNSPVRRLIKK